MRDDKLKNFRVTLVIEDATERKEAEEALKESEERSRYLADAALEGIAINENGKILEANRAYVDMFGYEMSEIRGMSVLELHPPEARDEIWQRISSGFIEPYQSKGLKKDGTTFDVEIRGRTILYEGRFVRITSIRDITEHRRAEKDLKESEERYRTVVEQSVESIFLFDAETKRVLESNTAFQKLLGYTSEELLRMRIYDFIAHERDEIDSNVRRDLRERRHFAGERKLRRKDGTLVDVEVSMTVIPYQGKEALCAIAHDVTEHKFLEEQLRHQAFHDSLTGLANRALFMDHLEQALARLSRREESVAVLFMDLDNFKVINDSLGHEVGDRLLVKVARRLKECIRPEDTVARFGGDEFVVLLEGIAELSDATHAAERIMEALRTPFDFEGRELFMGTSIGIALTAEVPDESEDLLRNADLALYRAKRKGRARYEIFEAGMGIDALERLELESALRRALEREEFRIYYQPKISVSDGRIVSLEALVRWEHPERGLLEPDEFLSVAEETGLIVQIGEWVLDEVCRQGREWQEKFADHQPPRVCTNISPRQFSQTDLVGRVTEVLQTSGLRAQGLSLEIAEGILMDDAEANVEKLTALKDLGIHIVIDDFGTAYSSLSYLRTFPLNFLKVDRSLVVKLGEGPEDRAIVSAMINLAHALGWAVTAQGVETEEQLELLRELGCDIVQGYYFSRPVTSEEATALLETNLSTPTES